MRFFRKPTALALCGLSLGTLTATYLQAIEHDGEGGESKPKYCVYAVKRVRLNYSSHKDAEIFAMTKCDPCNEPCRKLKKYEYHVQ